MPFGRASIVFSLLVCLSPRTAPCPDSGNGDPCQWLLVPRFCRTKAMLPGGIPAPASHRHRILFVPSQGISTVSVFNPGSCSDAATGFCPTATVPSGVVPHKLFQA